MIAACPAALPRGLALDLVLPRSPATMLDTPLDSPPTTAVVLDRLALLRVTGDDAVRFLDAQLTRNVPGPGSAVPAGYCSPKGRLLATFVVWSDTGGVSLLTAADVAAPIARRLSMYVLRAKAKVAVDGDVRIEGRRLDDADAAAAALSVWQTASDSASTWIRYPDADGLQRAIRVASASAPPAPGTPIDAETWRRLDIRAGLPTIVAATQDRFVPQMVNLEALDGVDFRKGCFPGQEVVARSQYLGKLKRRTARGRIDADAGAPTSMPGDDCYEDGTTDPVGAVVDAARRPDGGADLLVELPVAAHASTAIRAGSPDGPVVTLEPPPYPLPDNEVFVRPKL